MIKELVTAELLKEVKALEQQVDRIEFKRKEVLDSLALKVQSYQNPDEILNLLFVCTHNSRRSQLAEIWMHFAIDYYQLPGLDVCSAGTETTAFNPRMVDALNRTGFNLSRQDQSANPVYRVGREDGILDSKSFFSKTWEDATIPKSAFLAIMVCDHADQNCPFIPGSLERISLPYIDPKEADDTLQESETYDSKVLEIGREILYLARQL